MGCAWIPPHARAARRRDRAACAATARSASCASTARTCLPRSATEYFQQNCWVGVSQPGPADVRAALGPIGIDRFMWGSDYPHDEGTVPVHRASTCARCSTTSTPEELQQILGGNAAEALRLRPRGAAAGGATGSARRSPRSRSRSPSCPRTRTRRCCARLGSWRRRAEARGIRGPGRRPLQVLAEAALGLSEWPRRTVDARNGRAARSRSPSATALACSR